MGESINVPVLLEEALADLKANYILAIPTGLALAASLFLTLAVMGDVAIPEDFKFEEQLSPAEAEYFVRLMTLFFLSTVLSQYAHGVTSAMVARVREGGETSFAHALKAAFLLMPRLLPMSILTTVLLFTGFMMLILPGFLVFLFLLYSMPVLVVEGVGVGEALHRSFRLVRENLGASFSLFMYLMALVFGMSFVNLTLAMMDVPVVSNFLSLVLAGLMGAVTSSLLVRAYRVLVPKPAIKSLSPE